MIDPGSSPQTPKKEVSIYLSEGFEMIDHEEARRIKRATWELGRLTRLGWLGVERKRPRLGEFEKEGEKRKDGGEKDKKRKRKRIEEKKKTTKRRRRRREEQEMRRIRKTVEDPDQSTSSSPLVPMG